ncbi:hypothetical protein HD806DRAFT_521964 [Xylariaceae sp. AK1471]|nr:hypothetical protein HD806DRAFT_521964 [Xylariaceae sp. AK1471]
MVAVLQAIATKSTVLPFSLRARSSSYHHKTSPTMAQYLPLDRMSFASLDDDIFFNACSSQPASRLMSLFASREENELPEDINLARRPSEPLVSVCLPLGEAAQPAPSNRNDEPILESFPNLHDNSPKHHDFCPTAILHRLDKVRTLELPIQSRAASCDDTTSSASSDGQGDELLSSPAPIITPRCWSSVPCGDHAFITCSCQGRLPVITRAQLDGHISKQGVDAIICNIRVYLSTTRNRDCVGRSASTVAQENAVPSSSFQTLLDDVRLKTLDLPTDQYLITTDNIAAILDIVVAGMRRIQDESTQPECQSLLFPSNTHVKPSFNTRKIIPGVSSIADPATTIYSTRPCFSLASDLDGIEHPDARPKATYESPLDTLRRDNAHNTNADASGAKPQGPLQRPRLYSSRARQISWPQSPHLAQRASSHRVNFPASQRRAASNPFELQFQQVKRRPTSEPIVGNSSRNQSRRVAGTVSMTSFPRLQSRSCTNDWLTPLGLSDEMDDDEPAQTTADLYNRSIDAHSAVCTYSPLPILEEDSRATPPPPKHFPLPERSCSLQEYADQWSCQADDDGGDYGKRLGRSIGSASNRRIGVRAPYAEHQNPSTNLLDRLHRYSFMPHSEQTPECIRKDQPTGSAWVDIPLEGDGERKWSSLELLQEILNRSDPSSKKSSRSKSSSGQPNPARPRGSKQRDELGRVPCSEDTMPHVCMDEQWTPWTDQSSCWDEGQTC